VGCDINHLFVGFLIEELGDDAFTVEKVDSVSKNSDNERNGSK
jgi:hypothetical protein